MLNRALLPLTLGTLLLLAQSVCADTVILKSGEKVEGKVLSETDAEMTISVQVTASIKDERVIKKADIDRIEKVKADEVAWAPMAGLEPGQDSLESEDYQRVVAMLENFVVSHPQSPHVAVAKERLAKFQDEQRRVDQGQMKMDGEWLSPERVQEESVQLAGRIMFNRMRRLAAASRLVEAMAVFDVLEKRFGGSADYPGAVALAKQILPLLKFSAEQGLAQIKRRAEENKVRLKTAQGNERKQLEALLAQEKASTEAAVAAAEKSGARWLPLHPATDRSLTSLLSRISSESSRLNGVPLEKMKDSVKAAETAEVEFRAQNVAATEAALNEATSLWPANELAQRLKKKLAAAKAEQSAKKAADKAAPAKDAPAPKPKATRSLTPSARTSQPQPQPEPQPQPSAEPSFRKPALFVGASAIVVFGAIGMKAIAKRRLQQDEFDGR